MPTLEASLKLRDQFTTVLKTVDNALSQTAQTMSGFEKAVVGPAQALNQVASQSATAVNKLNSTLKVGMDTAFKVVKSSTDSILMLFGSFGNGISNKLNLGAVSATFGSFFNGLQTKASATFSSIGKMFNDLTGKTKKIQALEDIDRQLTQLSKKEAKIKINIDQAAQVKSEIDSVDKRLDRLSNAKAKIKTDVTSVTIAKERIAKLDVHVNKLNNKKAILQVEVDKIDRAKSHLADVQAEIDKLNSKKIEINTSPLSTALSKIMSGFASIASASATTAKKIGSNFGDAFNGAKNSFNQFSQDMKNGFTGISKSSDQATNSVKNFVGALGLLKVAGAAIGTVKNSIDGAIDRFDTLNQFPKMMQAVGFSMDEVDISRQRLVDGIDGLPTALNEVVPTTQRIATMTGDLENATRTTISLNNVFLASGADSARAAQGLEQYVQMLGRGEVNLTSWRSLMDTMPVALNDVAKAFGYTGKSAQYDLYDALNDGHVTFDEFNAKLIEMFDTGTEGAQRALIGSEGIKTSFKNIRTAVTNGVEGSIRKLDELSEAFTGKNIAQHLDGTKEHVRGFFRSINGYMDESGDYIEGFLDKIPHMIEKIKPYLDVLSNAFDDIKAPIGNAISAVKDSLGELMAAFDKEASISNFESFIGTITNGIEKLAGFIERHSDTIAKFITMLPKITAAFIGFKIGKGVLIPLLNFGKGIKTVLGATGKLAAGLGGSFLKIFGLGKNKKGSELGDGPLGGLDAMTNTIKPMDRFLDTLNGFAKGATNLALVFGVILLIKQAAKAMEEINKSVPSNFENFAKKLGNMALALGGMGAFVVVAGKLAKKDPAVVISGLIMVAGISTNILIATEAMKTIDQKVPDDFGNFIPKLRVIGMAIASMGALIGIVGAFTKLNPVATFAGLATVALISLELLLVAEAMKQVNEKVPNNITEFGSKVANMAIAIGSFALLAGAIGMVTASGIGGVAMLAGLGIIALVALELVLVAEVMKRVDEKVPDNVESFASKVANMSIAIGAFAGLATVVGLVMATGIGGVAVLLGLAAITLVALELMLVAEAIQQVDEKIPNDITAVKGKIDDMAEVIQHFGQANIASIGDIFNNLVGAINSAVVFEAINQLIRVAENLVKLNEIEVPATIESKIKRIMQALEALDRSTIKELVGSLIQAAELKIVEESVESMVQMVSSLSALQDVPFNSEKITEKIEGTLGVIEAIASDSLMSKIKSYLGSGFDKGMLTNMTESVGIIIQIADSLSTLQSISFDKDQIMNKISEINEIADMIGGDDGIFAKLGNILSSKIDSDLFQSIEGSIQDLSRVANELSTLQNISFDSEGLKIKITEFHEIANVIGGNDGIFTKLGNIFSSQIDSNLFTNIEESIRDLIQIANELSMLQNISFDAEGLKIKISEIHEIGDIIGGNNGLIETLGDIFSSKIDSKLFAEVQSSIQGLIGVADELSTLQNISLNGDQVKQTISDILEVIELLAGDNSLISKISNYFVSAVDSQLFEKVYECVQNINEVANELSTLQNIQFDKEQLKIKINEILEIEQIIGGDSGLFAKLGTIFSSQIDASLFDSILVSVDSLVQIANELSTLQAVSFDSEAIKKKVTEITEIGELISGENGFFAKLGQSLSSGFDASIFANMNASINTLIQIAGDLAILQDTPFDYWTVSLKINEIKNIIQQLNDFPEVLGLKGMGKLVSTLINFTEELNTFIHTTELSISGLESVSASFESSMDIIQISTETTMAAIQESAIEGMDSLNTALGTGMSTATVIAETGNLQIVNAFSGLPGELFTIGNHAMAGLKSGIESGAGAAIAAAELVANRIATATRSALDIRSPSRVMMEIGGFVSEGLANGISAGQNLVQNASDALTQLTIPDQLATVSATGTITNSVHVDEQDIERMRASASQTIVIQNKQLAPQITVNVENNGTDSLDEDEIAEIAARKLIDLIDSDLS